MNSSYSSRQYYYFSNGKSAGPATVEQLAGLAASGKLAPTDTVWETGSDRGVPASQVEGLFTTRPASPPPRPANTSQDQSRQAPTYAHDVFISYSKHDKLTADAICAMLERDQVRCWIAPRDVQPGVNYGEAIIDGINSSRLLVVVFSKASNGSPQVLREVERAVSKGIPVIPFRIEDTVPSKSMEYFLSSPHWLDALTKPLEAHIARLSTVVRAVLGSDHQPGPGGTTTRSAPTATGRASRITPQAIVNAARAFVAVLRRLWSRAPRRVRQAALAAALLVVVVLAGMRLFATDHLKSDYVEYRKNVVTGRGSVVFLQRVAPLHYSEWRGKAESGDPIAQLFIGRCYQEGFVVSKDEAAALPWLEKSAAQGNDFAIHTLGWGYDVGRGVKRDQSKALEYYTRAAELGNTASMRATGGLYESGVVGKPDPKLAFSWYRKAADAGDPWAMRLVGNCYLNGIGVTKDVPESERWYQRAADAGDTYLIGKNLGNRLAPHFAAYLKAGASESTKASSLAALRDLKRDYDPLDFTCVSSLFSASDLSVATNGLQDLKPDDPLRALHDELTAKYMTLYADASLSERISNLSSFALATESVIGRWFSDQKYDDVAGFWERSYKDIPLSDIQGSDESNALIQQMNRIACSLMKVGKRKEAADVVRTSLELCDRTLQENPWDWYLKEAYCGLCFATATVWMEQGEPAQAQPLLKRGWGVRMKQYGKEALLDRYPELPVLGKVPSKATDADREFFEWFTSGSEKKKTFISRFTVDCDFAGKKYPFFVYVFSGPRGYAELQDQFRWVKEVRGGEVPKEVRDSFSRLNKIAVENNVDFRELCVYALGTADKDKDGEKSKGDATKD